MKATIDQSEATAIPQRYAAITTSTTHETTNFQNTIAALEAFSYTVSHDLRAPLRAIRGFAQALEEDYGTKLDESGKAYVDKIVQAAGRMDTMIQDVLQYSQAVSAGVAFEKIDIESTVDDIIEDLQRGTGKRATFHVERPMNRVLGSKCLLTQALLNLLSNSAKFTDPKRPAVIRISTTRTGGKVRVYVQDNGIGISPEFREHLFEPFRRGTAEYEGTGVGLSIVKKAVERMAGRLGFDSTPGQGTTFWIEVFAAD